MKKIVYTAILLLLIPVFTAGCGPKPDVPSTIENDEELKVLNITEPAVDPKLLTPRDVVWNYFTALEEGKVDNAKAYLSVTTPTRMSDESLKSLSTEIQGGKKNLQIWKSLNSKNIAKVSYSFNRKSDGEFEKNDIYLVNENGIWKITYDIPKPDPFEEKADSADYHQLPNNSN